MAHLFNVTFATSAERVAQVVAETQEEALAKVQPNEGEQVTTVEDKGEVTL